MPNITRQSKLTGREIGSGFDRFFAQSVGYRMCWAEKRRPVRGGEPDASAPMIWSVRKGRGDLFLTLGSHIKIREPCDRFSYRDYDPRLP